MRKVLMILVLLPVLIAAQTASKTPSKSESKPMPKQTPKQFHASALVIDTHADTTQRLLDEQFDMATPPTGDIGHLDFAKAQAGNLGAEFFSIWVDPVKWKGQYAHRTIALIDSVYQQAEKHPDKMMMAFSAADIEKDRKSTRLNS